MWEGPARGRRIPGGMERAEAEAIYDAGREACVEILFRFGELEGRLDELDADNWRLKERVADLEERLRRSSRNSSLPPSADPPSAPPSPRKAVSGRRPGGQPGHEGRHRRLLPLERVDEAYEHWPKRCRACAHVFGEEGRIEASAPQRHQIVELPSIAVKVSEHRLHRLRCPRCACETRAELPPEVAKGRLRPAARGGGRNARGQKPRLTAGRRRARARAVRRRARDRLGRRDRAARGRGPGSALRAPARAAPAGASGQHRRDRLAHSRQTAHALGRAHAPDGGLPRRGRPARARGQGAARRGLPGHRRTAGGPTTISIRSGVRSAGRT